MDIGPFAVLATVIGGPLAVLIGWVHLERSGLSSSETDIAIESNPYVYQLQPGIAKEVQAPVMLMELRLVRRLADTRDLLTDAEKAEIDELEKKLSALLQGGYVGAPGRIWGSQRLSQPEFTSNCCKELASGRNLFSYLIGCRRGSARFDQRIFDYELKFPDYRFICLVWSNASQGTGLNRAVNVYLDPNEMECMNATARAVLRKVIPMRVAKSIRVLRNPDRYVMRSSVPWTYNQDGLATEHNCDFMKDSRFLESYKLGKATGSWGASEIHWRAYVCCWAADKVKAMDGDFVECGVNKGGCALAVMNYVGFRTLGKKFYLLDTFSGLVDRYITDEERKLGKRAGGEYEECYEVVVRTFEGWNAVIVRGAVPETLPLVKAKNVCYLSIDMNCVTPELAAAEFFWERMVSGAIMVLDDYGWQGHHLQKKAFDEFASNRKVRVLSLPTGQGLIFKP